MDDLPEFCARVMGRSDGTQAAAQALRRVPPGDREALLTAALAACRERESSPAPAPLPAPEPAVSLATRRLAQAVAGELAVANARLPQRQREALALREMLGLSHDQLARVIGIDAGAVAPLLARARLRFRAQLRGGADGDLGCTERERSLRLLARRQDSERVDEDDTAWLMGHLGECPACNRAHAAMLEASVCVRAWRAQAEDRPGSPAGEAAAGSAAGP